MSSSFWLRFIFSLIFCALSAAALAAPTTNAAPSRVLAFSSLVPKSQTQQLRRDLSVPLAFIDDDPAMKSVMGVPDLSDASLREWLAERVGYIICDGDKPNSHVLQLQASYVYPNDIMPDFEQPSRVFGGPRPEPQDQNPVEKVVTIMSNEGTAFYYYGKTAHVLLGYDFQSQNEHVTVSIRSPRVGILKIGDGFFESYVNTKNVNSPANVYFRLATLFHEAHHSDGNGKSLGFPHAVCPQGSDYYNKKACDRNANGPYTVQALFLRQAAVSCLKNKTCSEEEYERLALASVDAYGRVISKEMWDPTPEGL